MGIRFQCPNGHHLNVKSFLAGKRGICPDCGVKLVIPTESQTEPHAKSRGTSSTSIRSTSSATVADVTRDPDDRHPETPQSGADHPESSERTATTNGTNHNSTGVATETTSNDTCWYLCPRTGGQYGPVDSETINQWVAEGRVTTDALVWRNGWPDWVTAGSVFDDLKNEAKALPAAHQESDDVPMLMESSTTISRRRRSERINMTAIVMLVLAAILLSGALLLALRS